MILSTLFLFILPSFVVHFALLSSCAHTRKSKANWTFQTTTLSQLCKKQTLIFPWRITSPPLSPHQCEKPNNDIVVCKKPDSMSTVEHPNIFVTVFLFFPGVQAGTIQVSKAFSVICDSKFGEKLVASQISSETKCHDIISNIFLCKCSSN